MKPLFFFYMVSVSMFLSSITYAEQKLVIDIEGAQISYSQEALLNHPGLVILEQMSLPSYPNKRFNLKAVKLCELLAIKSKKVGSILKIQAFDNYISYFNLQRIHPCETEKEATAYIAIEEPDKPWPIIDKLKRSAGPFYLVWQGKKVEQPDWVFGVQSIQTTKANPLSKLLPAHSTALQTQGLEVFSRNCEVCHSINLVGNLEIGPDLNFPMNPTEYWSEAHLRQFIRNPQSIRYMKNDKMFAFTEAILSEQELNALIEFLKLMRNYKLKNLPKYQN